MTDLAEPDEPVVTGGSHAPADPSARDAAPPGYEPHSTRAQAGHGPGPEGDGAPTTMLERQRARREAWPDEWWEEIGGRRRAWTGTPKALLALAVVLGAFAFAGFLVYRWGVEQLDPPGEPGDTVVLSLGDGDTSSNIADQLAELGVIANADVYRWYVRLRGGPGFQAGEYRFQENSAAWDVVDALGEGPISVAQAVTFPVQFPEGLTVVQMIQRVEAAEDLPYDGAAFAEALRSPEVYRSRYLPEPGRLPEGVEELEGFLFPDTYAVQEGEDPRLLVERMMRRFDAVAEDLRLSESRDLVDLEPYETVVVASMIEAEAGTDADRPMIARVILNRLEAGWTLGIDATVVYATGQRELTTEELDIDSPYNTRRFPGLPPTPISSPGAASLQAALEPAEGDWMYYVRTEADGGHTFAVTDAEFQAAKQVCIERGFGCG